MNSLPVGLIIKGVYLIFIPILLALFYLVL